MSPAPFTYAAELRQAQIIASALLASVLVFTGMAVFAPLVGFVPQFGNGQLASMIMAGFALLQLLALATLSSSPPRKSTKANPAAQYVGRMIVRFALCEGACFGNLAAYLIERQWWSLAIVGGLMFIMLAMFPTQRKIELMIETQEAFSE